MISATAPANRKSASGESGSPIQFRTTSSTGLARDSHDTTLSGELVSKIFAAAPGGIAEAPQAVGPNFIIAQVTGIQHSTPAGDDFARGAGQLSAQAGGDLTITYANAARDREGVKVNQQMLQSALGQQ